MGPLWSSPTARTQGESEGSMNTQTSIRIEAKGTRLIPRVHVMSRMSQLMRRLSTRPLAARVRFSDVNGPKRGIDIRCGIVVTVPGQPSIEAEHTGNTARLAFDRSYERIHRRADQPRERWRKSQRHPKKYYAAKRLWT